jgi:septal ring factor EnvC (AmiA/AmiB activator)
VRTLRRWVIVAVVWAVAASAVAVIALLQSEETESEGSSRAAELMELSDRVDRIGTRLGLLADAQDSQSDQLRDATATLDEVEQSVSSARTSSRETGDRVGVLTDRINDLEDRIEDLETSAGSPDGQGGLAGP